MLLLAACVQFPIYMKKLNIVRIYLHIVWSIGALFNSYFTWIVRLVNHRNVDRPTSSWKLKTRQWCNIGEFSFVPVGCYTSSDRSPFRSFSLAGPKCTENITLKKWQKNYCGFLIYRPNYTPRTGHAKRFSGKYCLISMFAQFFSPILLLIVFSSLLYAPLANGYPDYGATFSLHLRFLIQTTPHKSITN